MLASSCKGSYYLAVGFVRVFFLSSSHSQQSAVTLESYPILIQMEKRPFVITIGERMRLMALKLYDAGTNHVDMCFAE